LNEKLAN
jgi:hypothetical protein